jgi:hypothetical protein
VRREAAIRSFNLLCFGWGDRIPAALKHRLLRPQVYGNPLVTPHQAIVGVFRESSVALLAKPGVRRSPLNYNSFITPGIVDVRS